MIEKRLPFINRLPNATNYTPSIDPYNPSVSYSKTTEVKLDDGSAAYYLQTITCMADQHSNYESVSLKNLQGSTAKAIEIVISGGIPANEAISIVNELYKILGKVNF
jgi:hypothetical protein